MPNPYFKFKQFTVYHDKCAMKVGTDAVLLGAWTALADAGEVLDIGTGTGIISLMLAQRSGGSLSVDALDIDKDAVLQAKENVRNSPFKNIVCIHASLQEYALNSEKKYDLIVSNPPYFSSSLPSPDMQRTLARHTHSLVVEDFVRISSELLSDKGRIAVVFPYSEVGRLKDIAKDTGLFVSRITSVYPTPTSQPKRVLLEFSVIENKVETSDLIIEKERHIYSPEFVALAKDFYLNM